METPLGDAAGVSHRMPTHAPERDLRHLVFVTWSMAV
jgi:hypothetical protein